MDKNLRFIYKKEFWYISALINTKKVDCEKKVAEIKEILGKKLHNLTEEDLEKIKWNEELMKQVMELGKNITLKCEWVPFIDYFPYYNENIGLKYDMLGFFKLDVEYFKENPAKKESITPAQIQQIPTVVLNVLKGFCNQYENQYLYLDRESPIFLFVTSDTIKDDKNKKIEVEWTKDNITKYKKVLGHWTEIYSGQWPDYSELLYTKRIQNNLSNRLSELHFIRRNSGFIFMVEENYINFFNSYMKRSVLEPTAQVRAMSFALISINESLDTLFSMKNYMEIKVLEKKIEDLRNTRGMIQTRMSLIYNELDYNRRQHYTSVLTHLITQFRLREILNRIEYKFDVIHDSMDIRYQKANRENQSRVERGMNYLNVIFIMSVVVDIAAYIIATPTLFNIIFNSAISVSLGIILLIVIRSFISAARSKREKVRKAVDTVILDDKKENLVLVKRKFPPCKDQMALPGGFIEEGESTETAALREAKEETGLELKVDKKIGVYDDPERDPRGRVISTAYICHVIGTTKFQCSDETKEVLWVPLKQLKGVDLAFDHEYILKDAVEKVLGKWPSDDK
ncbi:MAG: NUDIX domain-containing protein [Promethearchaeota archaeon]